MEILDSFLVVMNCLLISGQDNLPKFLIPNSQLPLVISLAMMILLITNNGTGAIQLLSKNESHQLMRKDQFREAPLQLCSL